MINVITFKLGATKTFYVQDEITLELLKKFINKVSPDLSVHIYKDDDEAWLEVQDATFATQYDGCEIYWNTHTLSWKSVEEIEL